MLYKRFDRKQGNAILDRCEKLRIECDVFNAEDCIMDPFARIEIGMTEADWEKAVLNQASLTQRS
jgi:hypothetical protein